MEDTTDLRGNKNRLHFPGPEDHRVSPGGLSQGLTSAWFSRWVERLQA